MPSKMGACTRRFGSSVTIDVALSYFPPETTLVTKPVAKALKKIITEKQKQERAARRRKPRRASPAPQQRS
jgi:hypothetical protein